MHDSTYRNDIIYLMNLIIIFGLSFIPCSITVLLGLPYNNNNNIINIKQTILRKMYTNTIIEMFLDLYFQEKLIQYI